MSPENVHALQSAVALFQSGNFDGAVRACRELLLRLPRNSDVRHLIALAELNCGRASESLAEIEGLLRDEPANAFAHNTRGAALQALGRVGEAIEAYRSAFGLDPSYLDAAGNLAQALCASNEAEEALQLCVDIAARSPVSFPLALAGGFAGLTTGRFSEAQSFFAQALSIVQDHAGAHYGRGKALRGLGRHAEAARELEAALKAQPGTIDWRLEWAGAIVDAGEPARAEVACNEILAQVPGHPGATALLGHVLLLTGRHLEAIAAFDAVLARQPADVMAHNNRGSALLALKRAGEAEAAFRTATQLAPGLSAPWHNLGSALLALGRHAECESAERTALAIAPGLSEATINLTAALNEMQRHAESEQLLRALLQREPDRVEALVHLAVSLSGRQLYDEAQQVLLEAVMRSPQNPEVHGQAAILCAQIGRQARAVELFDRAIILAPEEARWRVLRAMAVPVISESMTEIRRQREDMARRVGELASGSLAVADPARQIAATGFYLAYHGFDNVALQRAIAEMYLKLHPPLGWESPHAGPRSRAGRRLRVGFLSAHLRSHTIGKLYRGMISELDRSRFEVTVFRANALKDAVAAAIDQAADASTILPDRLDAARQVVSEAKLDILFYPDVGMSPFCFLLAFARLAPVQVTSWGHPDTTGLPNIDYFVSGESIETPGSELRYTERLVRLSRLPTFYARPIASAPVGVRERFALPPGSKLYACPQSLFKLHPDFDATLGALLEADPNGHLVLVASAHTAWRGVLEERFRRAFPGSVGRVHYAPTMLESDFYELLESADAVLDPLHFGGGNSSYEAFGIGVPVVTMPGPFMRGRVTLGCYRQMGIDDLVAADPAEYVALAVRLANDATFREEMRAKVRQHSGALFDDVGAVREIESFFERAFDEALEKARKR